MKKTMWILTIILSVTMSCRSDKKSEKQEREKIENQIKSDRIEKSRPASEKKVEKIIIEKEEKKATKTANKTHTDKPEGKKEKLKTPEKDEALLDKIGVSDTGNSEDGKVFNYKSENGENIKVIFRTYNNKKNYIVIKRSGKPTLELDQVEAWAKGAIYQKDSTKMEFDFKEATLEIGKETIKCLGDKEISN